MKPYLPSNGTEGMIFTERFCDLCRRYSETHGCKILNKTKYLDVKDTRYPHEWICNDDGTHPLCTAFKARSKHAILTTLPLTPDQEAWAEKQGLAKLVNQ